MRVVTVVGARPQFIKAAAVSREFRDAQAGRIEEILVHTGQHHDANMSAVFFDELDIPAPRHHLGIAGGGHGAMTGRMLEAIETVLLQERPDWVLVYGDTNSTLAGALAAAKMHVPVAHVEAGLRSRNLRMPEEINRILTDRISTLLFCPTDTAVANLRAEGMSNGLHQVGDVMFDIALHYRKRARSPSDILRRLDLTAGGYALATCHRAENTDDPKRLKGILDGLSDIADEMPVVFYVHPRTLKAINATNGTNAVDRVICVEPLPFLDMMALERSARVIVTDSGGVQKEAYFYGVPCVTLRDETEWPETVDLGWNELVGAERGAIARAALRAEPGRIDHAPYGDGHAAQSIVNLLAGR
jgi:UDP-GlcNAc3NAcA epimerase